MTVKVINRQITAKGLLLRVEGDDRIVFLNKEQMEVMKMMDEPFPKVGDTITITDSVNRAGDISTEYAHLG